MLLFMLTPYLLTPQEMCLQQLEKGELDMSGGDEINATPTRTTATSEVKEGAAASSSATYKAPPETAEAGKEEEKEPELPAKGQGKEERWEESVEEVGGHIYSIVDKCEH